MEPPRTYEPRVTKRIRKGLVIVNTGNGKGKTTAALGVLMRAWGRGMNVAMLQFVKKKTGNWGESRAAVKMEVEVIPLGDGFTWTSKDIELDKGLAQEGWAQCKEKLLAPEGEYDVVILDEITYPLNYNWLSLEEVLETLEQRPPMRHVILTGRDAPQPLIDYADLVTEMRLVKHPYDDQGIKAQAGIEF